MSWLDVRAEWIHASGNILRRCPLRSTAWHPVAPTSTSQCLARLERRLPSESLTDAAPLDETGRERSPSSSSPAMRSMLPLGRLVSDASAIALALLAAYLLRFELGFLSVTETTHPVLGDHVIASIVWFCGVLLALLLNRVYDEDTLFPGGGEAARLVRSTVEGIAVLSLFVFLTQRFAISRAWFLLSATLTTCLLLIERRMLARAIASRRQAGSLRRPIVIVAGSGEKDSVIARLRHEPEFVLTGSVAPQEALSELSSPNRDFVRGTILLLRPLDFSEQDLWKVVMAAGEAGLTVFVHATVRSMSRDRLTVREVAGETLVKISPPNLDGLKAAQKRLLDVFGAVSVLLLLSPVLCAIALGLLMTSGRPLIYSQQRVGRSGESFKIYKFRTMTRDAEPGEPVRATHDDPRRTPLGRILRRSSLDELPQLWNVLKGDMSLVGPRPERPTFVESLTEELPWYRYRHRIRPGITGWAQAHGLRGNTSLDSRIEFDNWYIEHWSIGLDLSILFRTIRELWTGRNAY